MPGPTPAMTANALEAIEVCIEDERRIKAEYG